MRVQVASGLSVDQANDVAVANEAHIEGLRIVVFLTAVGVEEPVIVGILVVIAGNLLLLRAFGVSLNVRVKQATAVPHVFERSTRSNGNLERAVLSNFGSLQVGLEQGTHLCITWSGVVENGKVEGEREHVDEEWDDNQANHTGGKMGSQGSLTLEMRLISLTLDTAVRTAAIDIQRASWCYQTYSKGPRQCTDPPGQ